MFGIGLARWPGSPPQSGVAQGFNLIPASGVNEVVGEEKVGGNGFEGMFSKDITDDKMTFLARKMC